MRRAILTAAILSVIGTGALAASPTLFKCKGKDTVTLLDDGTLGKTTETTYLRHVDYWIIDTVSGIVRIQDGSPTKSKPPDELAPEQWHVVQRGNKSNDTILVAPHSYLTGEDGVFKREEVAEAATRWVRIRQWSNKPAILFMSFHLSQFTVGTCEAL